MNNNCILMVTDDNYVDLTIVCLHSLVKQSPNADIILYVDGDISPYKKFKDSVNVRIVTYTIPILSDVGGKYLTVPNKDILAYRLMLLDEFKYKYDKILFLDVDTLIVDNFDELFDLSDDFIYGVNQIESHIEFLKSISLRMLYDGDIYFNSGVLLLPSKQLRRFNLFAEFLREIYIRGRYYICPEQDFINVIFENKVAISKIYNRTCSNVYYREKPKIIHYVSHTKPHIVGMMHLLLDNEIYRKYLDFVETIKEDVSPLFYKKLKDNIDNLDNFIKQNDITNFVRL